MNTNIIYTRNHKKIKLKMINILQAYCRQTKHFIPVGMCNDNFFLMPGFQELSRMDQPDTPLGLANVSAPFHARFITSPWHDCMQVGNRKTTRVSMPPRSGALGRHILASAIEGLSMILSSIRITRQAMGGKRTLLRTEGGAATAGINATKKHVISTNGP